MGNRVCLLYANDNTDCPPQLKLQVSTTAVVNNLDHNPSYRLAKGLCHGTVIPVTPHTTADSPGIERQVDAIKSTDKQRVLTPGHQGGNDLHSLCRIGMVNYLLNDDDDHDNNNNNNNNNINNNDNNDDNDDNNNNNYNNAVAEISIRGDFFLKAIINSLSVTCFSFISFYSELTSLYISTPYTYQVWK